MRILGATMGKCVHVAGIQSFLRAAKSLGNEVRFLGTCVTNQQIVNEMIEWDPEMVVLSYRLDPGSAERLMLDLQGEIERDDRWKGRRLLFGGTPPVAEMAKHSGIFEKVFAGGESPEEIISVLDGKIIEKQLDPVGDDLQTRIQNSYPYPLIRHHFGMPSLEDTIQGAGRLAQERSVDILSIAPDQNAQENFFRPGEMNNELDGAGGVPLRDVEDLRRLYQITRVGNRPLLRCYSGTRDLERWAEMLHETINNTWGAIPLAWYSELDGRSDRTLEAAMQENQAVIAWHADRGIPVEVTDSHQWSLRSSGDTIELVVAYLCAYNAKALGVRDYVCQFMFETPRGMSPVMDRAKMMAKLELVTTLEDKDFHIIRMVRSGLNSLSHHPNIAKGQLAVSVFNAMVVKPHIVHVVGYSEAYDVATPDVIIESCDIVRGAIEKALKSEFLPEQDPRIVARKKYLISEARYLLQVIKKVGLRMAEDPYCSPKVMGEIIRLGILDAMDLKDSKVAKGRIVTAIIDGGCDAVDERTGKPLSVRQRLMELISGDEALDLIEICVVR
ncbi:MAG TPA: cobalamin B12-binding domain-containing protein [Methanomassiliicoccales archaeon]|jgi:methylmalonyl-CoA mutase cobalamin-binding subunit